MNDFISGIDIQLVSLKSFLQLKIIMIEQRPNSSLKYDFRGKD